MPVLLDLPHEDAGAPHQDGRGLPYAGALVGVEGEDLLVRLGDGRQGLVDVALQGACVRGAGAGGQGLAGVARLGVQLGGPLEERDALGTALHGPVVDDLRPVGRR